MKTRIRSGTIYDSVHREPFFGAPMPDLSTRIRISAWPAMASAMKAPITMSTMTS